MRILQFRMTLQQQTAYIITQRPAHAAHLQGMSQPVVDEYTARQGEYLSLVLQAAERSRKNQTVIVALKLSAVVLAMVPVLLTKTPVG
jgi:hypothetical protein